jgi:coenzyme PQQ synthesis protein D (PqqD)
MPLSLARTHVSVPECVITRVVGERTVILDVDSGRSFTLDAVGTRVWTLLADTGSPQATIDALLSEFDADAARLEQDVATLIAQLSDKHLLDVHDLPA